jgi:hypothetical protein
VGSCYVAQARPQTPGLKRSSPLSLQVAGTTGAHWACLAMIIDD